MIGAEIIVWTLIAYTAIGVLFGVYFAAAGISKLDDAAKGTGPGFRLIIFPGTVAFWPLLLFRLVKKTHRPVEKNAHRNAVRSGVEIR
jgi:hypothetical protein